MKASSDHYEIFLKVAETGSITTAADMLGYTQGGVSHAIASLEQELSVTLFTRKKNGAVLTHEGEKLLPVIRDLVSRHHHLVQTANSLNTKISGRLRIGTFTSINCVWMPRIIRLFTAKYPDVSLEIHDGAYSEISRMIHEGSVDCGFLTAPAPDSLRFYPIYQDPLYAVLPPGHPYAARDSVTFEEIATQPVILQRRVNDNEVIPLFRKNRITPKIRMTLRDNISVLSFIASGYGVGIMPELMLKAAGSGLDRRPFDPPLYREIGLAMLPSRKDWPIIRAFLQFLEVQA